MKKFQSKAKIAVHTINTGRLYILEIFKSTGDQDSRIIRIGTGVKSAVFE